MELGGDLLRQSQPPAVVGELVVGVDPALHADLGRPERDRLGDPALEVVDGDLVGVGRAPPWPKPQNAHPTTQTLVKLTLRLTTNVAVSPASSARSSSAATRIASITSGRASANSAVSSSLGERLAIAAALDRARGELRVDRTLRAPPRPAPRDEAPVLELDHVEDPLVDPARVEVLRIGAEPLGERVAAPLEALAHLMRARERLLGRDVVAVRREAAEVGGAGVDEVEPPVGEVGRDLDPDVRHQLARGASRGRSCRPG